MNDMYPYMEYMKVFFSYTFLLYIWPNVVFQRYLKGKGLTFRFMFCSTVQIVSVNGTILGMGLFDILNVWLIRGIFWGMFFISAGMYLQRINREHRLSLKGLMRRGKEKIGEIWLLYKSHLIEYLILIFIVLFGMIYFSIGQIQEYTYGHYDQYIHFQWVEELGQGNIFSDGIYPEAMHCFLYCLSCLFGLKLYSCVLFLSGIHISAFLLAAYCLLKEVFRQRGIPLFILLAWLTYDAGINGLALARMYSAMARLSWTLPQEFGIYLAFLCPTFLLRFFHTEEEDCEREQWYRNENLFLLMMGVGAALAVHFYDIILAFFCCLAVVIVYFKRFICRENILFLIYATINGINAGAFPMIVAYLMGIHPQGSLQWGVAVLNGATEDSVKYSAGNNTSSIKRNILKEFYEKGCVAIFGEENAVFFIVVLIFVVLLLCAYGFYSRKGNPQDYKRQSWKRISKGYYFVVFTVFIYLFLYAGPSIGVPEFVAVGRIFTILKMFIFSMTAILIDILSFFPVPQIKEKNVKKIEIFGCLIIYCFAYLTDFHDYLYSYFKRYKSAALVTDEIIDNFDKHSYLVVSMGDEKGQMNNKRREELFVFLQNLEEKEYFLPVEYIFLYVEKCPVVQGQIHFYTGPSWIAGEPALFDETSDNYSQCPDIKHTEISLESSQQDIVDYSKMGWYYWDPELRTIVSSKAYYWYQDFAKENPEDTFVYYEDDDFVCYMICQNPKKPLNLAVGQ